MGDERRVIGYDVGVGGDDGPVYARADGAGESATANDLPAGWGWDTLPHKEGAVAEIGLYRDGADRGEINGASNLACEILTIIGDGDG